MSLGRFRQRLEVRQDAQQQQLGGNGTGHADRLRGVQALHARGHHGFPSRGAQLVVERIHQGRIGVRPGNLRQLVTFPSWATGGMMPSGCSASWAAKSGSRRWQGMDDRVKQAWMVALAAVPARAAST